MQRQHLGFLDGLRGLAALYVVVFHLMMTQDLVYHLPMTLFIATRWLRYGHYAVDVFIVLSGYCLMLPVNRAEDGQLPGGLKAFIFRRARRILPPYYAALVFTLCLIWAIRSSGAHVRADDGTAFAPGNLAAHVLMIHDLFPQYADRINLPLWTVAFEWHIYFVFAMVLLPVWRRFGVMPLLIVALLIGELPRLVLPSVYDLSWTRPWYITLFAFGMTAALGRKTDRGLASARTFPFLGRATFLLFAILVTIESIRGDERSMECLWAKDLLVGLIAALLIMWCAIPKTVSARPRYDARTMVVNFLESRPIVGLGTISYSLYLIHMPLMWIAKAFVQFTHLRPYTELAFRLTLAPLLMLPCAYVFYRAFERPFLSNRMRHRHQAEVEQHAGPDPVLGLPSKA